MPRKDIEIRIAATGGDRAAAEIKKVEGAGEDLNTSNVRIVDATIRYFLL